MGKRLSKDRQGSNRAKKSNRLRIDATPGDCRALDGCRVASPTAETTQAVDVDRDDPQPEAAYHKRVADLMDENDQKETDPEARYEPGLTEDEGGERQRPMRAYRRTAPPAERQVSILHVHRARLDKSQR